MVSAAQALAMMKVAEDAGVPIAKPSLRLKAKQRAKVAIAAELALGKILAPPKEASGLPRHGKDIVAKLKKKGIGRAPRFSRFRPISTKR